MKKKIYFLINSLEAWWGERQIVNLCNNFDPNQFDVTIITLKSQAFYTLHSNVRHISLSHIKRNFLMFLMIPYFVIKLRNIFKRENFDNGISTLEIANFVHLLAKKNALIYCVVSLNVFKWFIGGAHKLLIRLLYPRAQKILANSAENTFDLAKYLSLPMQKFDVLYNPIDKDMVEQSAKEDIDTMIKNRIKNHKVFVTVWRLVWQKRHHRIISALSKIYKEKDKRFVYLILWDWPEKRKLEKFVIKLWLQDNVIFLWTQKNVFKYLNIADCFLYASDYEWFPNVFVEAILCKLPILTTNFKTWAQEAIFWEYTPHKIHYPCLWENWILLDAKMFEKQFFDVYDKLDTLKTQQKWLDNFLVDNVTKKAIQILF